VSAWGCVCGCVYFHYSFTAYKSMAMSMEKHRDASILISFASLRSVYETTLEALDYPQVCVFCF
jgi:hypothetical protein